MRHILICLVGLLIAAARSQADISITGKVVDETGSAVAGARLELQPVDTGAAVVAFSDRAGSFSLTLPAAGGYRIHAVRQGFFVLNEGPQTFSSGQNLLTVALIHQKELAESIDVVYSPPAIDLQEPAERKELDNTQVQSVPYPAPQDFRNALPMMNGVVQDTAGRLHFNGGAVYQTNFLLDGFHVSDPVTGQLEARLNIDSIRSLDVEMSRMSAETGRGGSGSLDVKTKMGDDRLRFGGTNFIPGVSTEQGLHINKWTPRLELSGPFAKGRAWFYNGFDAFYDQDYVHGLPHGQNRTSGTSGNNLSRFQVNLTPANILTGSFLVNHSRRSRLGLAYLNPAETTTTSRNTLYFSTLRDQMYFSGGALLEVGFADTRGDLINRPQGTALYQITPSGNSGNYFVNTSRHFYRQQWLVDAFLPVFHAAGSHQLKIGADLERESFHQQVDRHDYEVLRVDGSVARHVTFIGSPFQNRKNFAAAEYVQDHWTPRPGVVVEAGLRAEWNEIVRDLEWAPRISAVWAPGRKRETKLSAGYGIFFDAIRLGVVAREQDEVSLSTFYSPSGALLYGPVPMSFVVDETSLRAPRYRTLSLSVERPLPYGFSGKATYQRRTGSQGFTFLPPSLSSEADFYAAGAVFRLANARSDRYDAFEVSVHRTFAKRYEWFGGYTRSNARTNAVVEYSLENPIFGAQMSGHMGWDNPHRLLSWGWAPVPKSLLPEWLRFATRETDVQYLAEFRSGFPFGAVNEEGLMVGRADGHRYPAYFNLNLHFEKRFRALHYLWSWRFGFNNLTNSGNPNTVNNNVDSSSYLTYGRGQSRAFSVRLRFLGKR
jgi:hypothetical protein